MSKLNKESKEEKKVTRCPHCENPLYETLFFVERGYYYYKPVLQHDGEKYYVEHIDEEFVQDEYYTPKYFCSVCRLAFNFTENDVVKILLEGEIKI